LIDLPLSIPEYFSLVSRLDLMIGMRLHSTLTALRFGVPSINISYTLKGGDILAQMGLAQDVVELDKFVEDFAFVKERADLILADLEDARHRVAASVNSTIRENNDLLGNLIRGE
jgi:polysaccharide pyruvyl transferase WcaK-like protein